MAKPRNLNKAPITEAVIEFQVSLPSTFDYSELKNLSDSLRDEYPDITPQRFIKGEMRAEAGDKLSGQIRHKGLMGYILKNKNKAEVLQLKADRFTFNKLAPYTKWDDIFPKALKFWKLYKDTCKPENINRLTLRYINHLNIPKSATNLNEYLEALPSIPKNLDATITNFLTRIQIQNHESNFVGIITQTPFLSTVDSNYATIILDLDVVKEFDRLNPENEANIKQTFEQLREFRTKIFFESISEKMVELLI